ncbi:MAG: hypothetical protein K9N51_05920 [Candidatus Pacebacteria bacterium]|nr:hypothetical protein [Candidatus Paceibacterota bacterium]
MQFAGQDKCRIDANGRIKLTPRFLDDFRNAADDVILHCLVEGALGVYPASVWKQMRQAEPRPAARAATSTLFRRQLRRFGAFTQVETITNQGRITVPTHFRDTLNLQPRTEVIMVGCEIGIEIWNAEAWRKEAQIILEHQQKKAIAEMEADLTKNP